MKIRCTTSFDITATGVTGHCKPSRLPFKDNSGQMITNEQEWNHARNQQRNLETLTQLISLRTQIDNITRPQFKDNQWSFEFEVESDTIFVSDQDNLGVLKNDCLGVPMLLSSSDTTLNDSNIQFELINIS